MSRGVGEKGYNIVNATAAESISATVSPAKKNSPLVNLLKYLFFLSYLSNSIVSSFTLVKTLSIYELAY